MLYGKIEQKATAKPKQGRIKFFADPTGYLYYSFEDLFSFFIQSSQTKTVGRLQKYVDSKLELLRIDGNTHDTKIHLDNVFVIGIRLPRIIANAPSVDTHPAFRKMCNEVDNNTVCDEKFFKGLFQRIEFPYSLDIERNGKGVSV